ncbi:MAG: hypothetical protein BGO31_00270 [Bacteroidetes bacterium 43-16]|uniref:HsdM family class I SAM-dependent methyltransferase n=1 Tax=Bacteroidota TaxID=976 RepID=UPI0009265D01|nr:MULTISPECIES: N-6 DNA methylase [Bacteroidota]OJV51674.1 MAG: hypothetical protein BGO31_00270 [Bacteroidetes bacterium 43-16]
MDKQIFKILKKYSNDTFKVNSLIISAFIQINEIAIIKNLEIKNHIIKKDSSDWEILLEITSCFPKKKFGFEELIELFEFVISPSDKLINGAVYTPKYIREYITDQVFQRILKPVNEVKAVDISCGCGGFLLSVASKIQSLTKKTYDTIFKENIYGIDIEEYSVVRAKLLLSLFAIINGEDKMVFSFNLFSANSLLFDWKATVTEIRINNGFDIVVGNPPYVASRNMEKETIKLLSKFKVASTGHPDLYIPFFQIGYELLNKEGILGYITVNTFTKSINGRALRQYFQDQNAGLEIITFGGEQIFKDRNTYTCICFLNQNLGYIRFIKCSSNELEKLKQDDFNEFKYEDLNNFDGWNLTNSKSLNNFITTIESVGKPFKSKYVTKNGIATLKNYIYKFVPLKEDQDYYYLPYEDELYPIEKGICRDIINANKLKKNSDLINKLEKIIFPYYSQNDKILIIPERMLKKEYPKAYKYLFSQKDILATRDKGEGKYEEWYAFGRRQSLDIKQYKLFFPHICNRPSFVISEDPNLLFYNGIAVVNDDLEELKILKKIMETDMFFKYIQATTKDYASGYLSMSRNYLKNFGIYDFNKIERSEILKSKNPELLIQEKYNLDF